LTILREDEAGVRQLAKSKKSILDGADSVKIDKK